MAFGNPTLVPRAQARPNHCAVFPSLGQAHRDGYFDTGVDLQGFDNRVYVSVEAVRVMARKLDWKGPEDFAEVEREREQLERELEDVRAQLAEADRELSAVYSLKSRGWTTGAKPGRKAKEPA